MKKVMIIVPLPVITPVTKADMYCDMTTNEVIDDV